MTVSSLCRLLNCSAFLLSLGSAHAWADSTAFMTPADVAEVLAPQPLEISGVAAVPGGYAVVGDNTRNHGRIWPDGGSWRLDPKVNDAESIDVGFSPLGETLWLILGEDYNKLVGLSGGRYKFSRRYNEVCGRGLEGLAVRWSAKAWQVAVLWEGGFYGRDCTNPRERFANPRVAILTWRKGLGSDGPDHEFELDVPVPADGHRFRAPDLVWLGDDLLVLLASTDEGDRTFNHTWLQPFDLEGKPTGTPLKLEERWGAYREGKNWEALDWALDGNRLVMGFDASSGRRFLTLFPYPN